MPVHAAAEAPGTGDRGARARGRPASRRRASPRPLRRGQPANVAFMRDLDEHVRWHRSRHRADRRARRRARARRRPELVLVDINLPGMSGLDALRAAAVRARDGAHPRHRAHRRGLRARSAARHGGRLLPLPDEAREGGRAHRRRRVAALATRLSDEAGGASGRAAPSGPDRASSGPIGATYRSRASSDPARPARSSASRTDRLRASVRPHLGRIAQVTEHLARGADRRRATASEGELPGSARSPRRSRRTRSGRPADAREQRRQPRVERQVARRRRGIRGQIRRRRDRAPGARAHRELRHPEWKAARSWIGAGLFASTSR